MKSQIPNPNSSLGFGNWDLFWILSLVIGILSLLILLLGCSSIQKHLLGSYSYEAVFRGPYPKVWKATLKALEDLPLEELDEEKGKIQTAWVERVSERKQGLGIIGENTWIERFRLTLHVKPNDKVRVQVLARFEQRARGGKLALRWFHKESTGETEKRILRRIEDALAKME